jgi:hypothetical protein
MTDTSRHPWAVSMMITEEFLDGLAVAAIGDGIDVTPLRQVFQLPMMGPIELTLALTITGVTFKMTPELDGRLFATISAAGTAVVHSDTPLQLLPGVARVRGEVLVDPVVRLDDDGSFTAILDVLNSDLVAMVFEGIDGLDADSEAQLQISELLFAAIGGELFEGLARQLGSVGLELGPERGSALVDLGVATGDAVVVIRDGKMIVGLPAVVGLGGEARPVEVHGTRIGIGVASGALGSLVEQLVLERYGMGLPFELEVDTVERRVGGRIRNLRLIETSLPDLRSGVRYTIRPRLEGDTLSISVREAWIELPSVLPPLTDRINRINRWLGGAASRAPLNLSVPARASVPVRPGSTATVRVAVVGLDVDEDGVELTVDAAL